MITELGHNAFQNKWAMLASAGVSGRAGGRERTRSKSTMMTRRIIWSWARFLMLCRPEASESPVPSKYALLENSDRQK